MSITTKLGLPDFNRLNLGASSFNQTSRVMDGLIHAKIVATVTLGPLNASPLPVPGSVYIVGGTPVDVPWAGHDDELAIATENVVQNDPATQILAANWNFVTPVEGFTVWYEATQSRRTFNGSGWYDPAAVANLNGESASVTATRIILLLTQLRGLGVIAT